MASKNKNRKNIKNNFAFYLVIFSFGVLIGTHFDKISSFYTLPEKVSSDDIEIDVRFSPNGGCQELAKKAINLAEKKILVQSYYFTSMNLAKELVRAKNRGIIVKIIMDKSQLTHKYSKLKFFLKNDIDVYIDNVSGLSHNKIMIIDDYILTGSYNWTDAAEKRNCENLLLIKSPVLAKIYSSNWLYRKNKSQKVS